MHQRDRATFEFSGVYYTHRKPGKISYWRGCAAGLLHCTHRMLHGPRWCGNPPARSSHHTGGDTQQNTRAQSHVAMRQSDNVDMNEESSEHGSSTTTHTNMHSRSTNTAPRTTHSATSVGPWFNGSLPRRRLTTYRTQAPHAPHHPIPPAFIRGRDAQSDQSIDTPTDADISPELTNLHSSKAPRQQQRQRSIETKSQSNSSRNLPRYRKSRAARRTRHA